MPEIVIDARSRGEGRVGGHTYLVFIGMIVGALALARMYPWQLVYEEPQWLREASIGNILEPWNGFVQVFARISFLVASVVGPFATQLLAAGAIAFVAVAIARSPAIPDRRVALLAALALPLLPIPYPGPYIGPLNSAWWFAVAVILVALDRPRRWHYPTLFLAGLTGAAPCAMLPVFRDRRGLALAAAAAVQAVVFLGSDRHPRGVYPSIEFLWIAFALLATMAVARLPMRTRLAFAYGGLVILAFGAYAMGWGPRYYTIAGIGIALASASLLRDVQAKVAALVRRQDRHIGAAGVET